MASAASHTAVPAPRSPLPTGEDLRDSQEALFAQAAELTEQIPRIRPRLELPRPLAEALAPAREASRMVALDAARVLATFGVMWTHVVEMQGHGSAVAALGRCGTSFYIGAAVLLATRSALKHPDRSLLEGMRQRGARLLVPFALWSLIYAVYYSSIAFPKGVTVQALTVWWGPLAGTARHLWFLPFAFFAGTVATWAAPHLKRLSTRQLAWGTVAAAAATYWYCHEVLFFALDRFWMIDWHLHRMDRWVEEIPLMVLAIGLAHLLSRYQQGQRSMSAAAAQERPVAPRVAEGSFWRNLTRLEVGYAPVLLALFVAFQLVYSYGHEFFHMVSHSQARYMANFAGLSLLGAFLLAQPRQWMQRIGSLGKVTYFAFLVHVLLLDYGNGYAFHLPGFGTIPFAILFTGALLAASAALGGVVRTVPGLRWLVP